MAVTFNTNWLGGIIGGGLGALSGYQKMSYINDMYENMWEAAAEKYKATEDAINITKVAAESQMRDVIGELQRVGASYQKEVEKEGQKAMSQQRASREGLTGGNTAVRQDIATQIKINQVAAETQEKTQSMINQVVDAKDSKMNQLNTQLLQAWTEAQGVLSRKAPTEYSGAVFSNMFSSILKGFGQGWQLQSRIEEAIRPPQEPTQYALSSAYKTVKPEFASRKPFVEANELFIQ